MSKPSNLEKVFDKRTTENGQIEYMVKWKNQTSACWEPIINLKNNNNKKKK